MVLALEQLTKATGKMKLINPDTGDPVLTDEGMPVLIAKRVLSPSKAAAVMDGAMMLRTSERDASSEKAKIWRYDGGIWRPDGEREIVRTIDAVIGDLSYEKGLREALRRIRGISDVVIFDSNPYLFPALDKVIDLQTGLVRDYLLEDYLTFQYGVAVDDPAADYRPVLWAMCSSLQDPRDVLTALDITTAAYIRRPLDAIIQLIGPGANGKGIFERMLIKICTEDRVAALTLTEAKASRFGPGAVLGKDIWILSEVEDVKYAINLLKKVATGEFTDSDVKYEARVHGKPHVLPILDCNNAIDFGDDSWGRKRRVIKLDYPHTFDYTSDTRLKDPHLEEKVTSPSALAGLLQIVAARAPFLCKSRRIYSRKRPEEMDAEYKRQQNSLQYFCDECLTTEPLLNAEGRPIDMTTGQPWPGGVAGKLTIDALYSEYMKYCRLLNVPVPIDKNHVGKYINSQLGILSVVTRENKVQIRYYPGLWLAKTAKLAFDELSLSYSSYSKATGELQENEDKNTIYSLLATAATGEWPKDVIEEIARMFCYIQSCQNPQDISYRNYLENAVSPVAAVALGRQIAIPENSAVALPKLCCSLEPGTVAKADLLQADVERAAREQHFRTPITLKAIYKSKGEALEYANLSLNLYAGCSHGCLYCYNRGKFRSPCTEVIKKSSLENIESDLKQLAALENKTPVHLSFIGDPFDLGRSDNSYTHRALEMFKKYQHPFQILTKGGMKAIQELDLYFEGCSFGCTLTFDNPEDSRKWEPGAALPEDRIAALELAHKKGIKTWASLEPVIDPFQSLHLIELTHEFVDHYGVGKLNHDAALEKRIDWRKFRADAEALLKKYGKSYRIKAALAEASQGGGAKVEGPDFQKFAAGMKKRHCLQCGRTFSYDLGIHYLAGYICTTCSMGQTPASEPVKSDLQKTLNGEAPA
jgi:DNA repair photolyase